MLGLLFVPDHDMADTPAVPGPTLDDARLEVGRILSDHFAEDRITVEEFERRLELTFKATTVEGVRDQLAGLPTEGNMAQATLPAYDSGHVDAYQPRSPRKTFVAFMSGVTRRGSWSVPATLNVVAFMGGVELDLRHARLGPGITRINVFAFMGGAEITVPPDIRVETDGIAIMGGFQDRETEPLYGHSLAPTLRVTGIAIMGGVEVRVRRADPE